jgi:HAD superfamily hydrolase (TIGR01509 family)
VQRGSGIDALPALLIFDCDGVLVDSEPISHAVLRELLAEHGVSLGMEQMYAHFMGANMDGVLRIVAELLHAPVPEGFLEEHRARTFRAFATGLSPVAGIPQLLDSLPMPYCVASNGPHAKMQCTLGVTGLLPRFAGRIFSADDVRQAKPAPDLFLLAAQSMAANPADCVVVDDSPVGILAARAAGMRALGFAAMMPAERLRAAGAHEVFGSMDQLPSLLRLRRD